MSLVTVCCEWCRKTIKVRAADRRRGWGRFCSKRCKAMEQEKRTGQNAAYVAGQAERDHNEAMEALEAGWDGHKNVF